MHFIKAVHYVSFCELFVLCSMFYCELILTHFDIFADYSLAPLYAGKFFGGFFSILRSWIYSNVVVAQVLNSGTQLAVARPAPEPPQTTQRNGSQVGVVTQL
jgi:hypothetical protein